MSEVGARGALVLLCRSVFADHFNSFKPILRSRLRGRYGENLLFSDILTLEELANSLLDPLAPFDIAELHVLAEFESGRLLINPARDVYFEAGKPAALKLTSRSQNMGQLLPNATINLWYLARSGRPDIDMLNEWSDYFGRRCLFLPLTKLKAPVNPPASKPVPNKPVTESSPASGHSLPAFAANLSMLKIIMIIAAIGGIHHFVADEPATLGLYYQVVSHEDSPDDIAWLTSDLRSDRGSMVEHSWVFRRTRWDFTFFVASEWLRQSARELQAAAASPGKGDQYWGNVYREIIDANYHRLDNVAGTLRNHAEKMNLDSHDMASFVLSFVQHIRYKIPDNRLELLAPPQTVDKAYGDCDSKSLLYALIMRKLGYDTVIYVNHRLSHAMAGINTAASGKYMSHQGARYYFAEATAIGHRIGQLPGSIRGWHLITL